MSFKDLIPYFFTLLTFLWGIRQYSLNQRTKKRDLKYATYSKISAIINEYKNYHDRLPLSLDINDFKLVKQKLIDIEDSVSRHAQKSKELDIKIEEAKDHSSYIKNQFEELQIGKNPDELILINETINLQETLVSYLTNELNSSQKNLDILTTQQCTADAGFFEVLNKHNDLIVALSTHLNEFILNFNSIDDLQIISSQKVIKELKITKELSLSLKSFFNELLPKQSHEPIIVELSKSEQ